MDSNESASVKLGQYLKEAREKVGVSLTEVAETLELSIHEVGLMEFGKRDVPLHDLYVLVNLFNIAPEEFLDFISATDPAKFVEVG
jgi:transcriptional regulator with XRE-family HTH domain